MRHHIIHLKNALVPTLIVCTLFLLVGCGGPPYSAPDKPYDIDKDIRQTEAEIQMHRSAIAELETKLKDKQSRLGGPSILEFYPKSEAEKDRRDRRHQEKDFQTQEQSHEKEGSPGRTEKGQIGIGEAAATKRLTTT